MKARIQARIYSSKKTDLAGVVPLETPYSVHIDICSLCNFKCRFCFQSDTEAIKKSKLKRGLMEFGLFKKIVDDSTHFKERFRKVKIGLHGEPTMHPELPEMIRYLKNKNVSEVIELFTNGSLLNPRLNRGLIDAGLTRLNISIEALTAAQYREIAGANVDFEGLVATIKDLYDVRRECRIYIKIVNAGLKEADERRFYATFGNICDEIFIENVVPQWAETNKFAIKGTGMYGQEVGAYKHVCPFPFMYLHFNYDGTASGCTLDWGRKVLIGDVRKESVLEIWRGKKLRDLQIALLRKQRSRILFCSKCLAPMVCCLENLDDHAERLLTKIGG